jgi:anaerobic selenocysteine-containing dehydrogenase
MNRSPTSPATATIVKAACPHDCPDTCALEVHVRDGVAVKVAGAAEPLIQLRSMRQRV